MLLFWLIIDHPMWFIPRLGTHIVQIINSKFGHSHKTYCESLNFSYTCWYNLERITPNDFRDGTRLIVRGSFIILPTCGTAKTHPLLLLVVSQVLWFGGLSRQILYSERIVTSLQRVDHREEFELWFFCFLAHFAIFAQSGKDLSWFRVYTGNGQKSTGSV